MRFKFPMTFVFLFIGMSIFAQDLDAYKYIVVPRQFDFLRSADQYQLNSLTKFLFNKKGMVALFEDEKQPDELFNNQCLGLKTKIVESSNLLSTKLAIELIDCRNTTVYTSQEGKSKIKDLKKAHHDALRKAFQSIQALSYSYDPSLRKNTITRSETPVLEEVKETPVEEPTTETEEKQEPTEVTESTSSNVEENSPSDLVEDTRVNSTDATAILYAQEITNGYQLVDNTPKIVFKALKSANDDNLYYLEGQAGILYKKDGFWYAEYYKDGVLIKEKLTIKF